MPKKFNHIKNKSQIVSNIEINELTFLAKLFFALAGMPYQMFFTAISVFTSVFLLEKAQLSPSKISVIIFVSR